MMRSAIFLAAACASIFLARPVFAREAKEQVEKRMRAAAQLIIALDDGDLQTSTVAIAAIEMTLTTAGRAAFHPLKVRLGSWRGAVAKKMPVDVAQRGDLERDTANLFGVDYAPAVTPDLPTAVATYRAHCESCHGPAGRGDGPLAKKIKSGVPSFADSPRASVRAPFVVFHLISNGRPDTAMPAFGEKLDPSALWSVAFFVTGFKFAGPVTADAAAASWGAADLEKRAIFAKAGLTLPWLSSHDLDEVSRSVAKALGTLGKSAGTSETGQIVGILRGSAPFVGGIDQPGK